MEMITIKPERNESLRNYISMFDKESLQVLNPKDNNLILTFRQGLNSDNLESETLKFNN